MPILAISDKPLGGGSLLETKHAVSDSGYKYIMAEFRRFNKLQEFLLQIKFLQPVAPDKMVKEYAERGANWRKQKKEEEKQDD